MLRKDRVTRASLAVMPSPEPVGMPALPNQAAADSQCKNGKTFSIFAFLKNMLMSVFPFAIGLLITPGLKAEQDTNDIPRAGTMPEQTSVATLRAEIAAMKAEYQKRIGELESRLEKLEVQMLRTAAEVPEPAVPQPAVSQAQPGALNPAITVIGNLIGHADSQKVFNEDGGRIDNKMMLREAEIDMRVPVDPYADGVLVTAFEAEAPGKFSIGIEEGYVNIKKLPFMDRPPLGLRLKVGRFRPLFGSMNILHTHDLPQTFRPLPIQEFLGPEGFVKDGISANFFLPAPSENATLDMTLDALTGGAVAVSPDLGGRMSYLGHLRYYHAFGNSHSIQIGWSSYYQPKRSAAKAADIHGCDFLYRWKPARMGEWKSFLLGSELLFGRRPFTEAAESPDVLRAVSASRPEGGRPLGFYIFAQSQFNRRTYTGVRYDQTDVLVNPALKRRSITPYLSYYFSEFLRFRLNYERRWSDLVTEHRRNSVFAEINFVFGSHPREPFWVNK